MTTVILVSPSNETDGCRAYSTRGPLFDATVSGRLIVSRSTQPLLDGCRVLLAEGIEPRSRIGMRHAGSETDAMVTTVGSAARLTVREGGGAPMFRRYEDGAHLKARMGGLGRREKSPFQPGRTKAA
jgi:hypothetical protein